MVPSQRALDACAKNLRLLRQPSGEVVGRICVSPLVLTVGKAQPLRGAVTSGGFVCDELNSVQGVLTGETRKTARNEAEPTVDLMQLSGWANEQAALVANTWVDADTQLDCARVVWILGGDTGPLPIAESASGLLTYSDIAAWVDPPEEVVLIGYLGLRTLRRSGAQVSLHSGVLAVPEVSMMVLRVSGGVWRLWPGARIPVAHSQWFFNALTLKGAVGEALAKAWGVPLVDMLDASELRDESEREVGSIGHAPLSARSLLMRNPKKHPPPKG